jgi:hypothetical protein
MVTIPSDSSPPYVSSFLMPVETIDDSSPDAPLGTQSRGQPPLHPTDASFAGGRPRAVPGDLGMRGRDGNFIILHRGGVLSVGATELSQRMFFPLGNLILDVSENYEHHNSAGSIQWGIQEGPSKTQYPAVFTQTFRVFANDAYADVRVSCGKISPLPEPDASLLADAGVGQSDSSPIIFELVVSPKGFISQSGAPVSAGTTQSSVFKFTFDRTGNALLRAEGNVYQRIKKNWTVKVDGSIDLESAAHVQLKASTGCDIDGGQYSHVKGDMVRLGPGERPVACVGDIVSMPLTAQPIILQFGSPPVPGAPIACTLTTVPLQPLAGQIVSGTDTVRA